jgi:hypothetical protein
VTALCVIAGVALSVYTAVQTPGRFHGGAERGFNTFAFFTVQSNLIVGVTTLLLALKLDRRSTTFRTFRPPQQPLLWSHACYAEGPFLGGKGPLPTKTSSRGGI